MDASSQDESPPGGAPPPGLAARLRRVSSRRLLSLVDDHGRDLGLREVRQVLLNPYVTGEVIEALAMNRKLTSEPGVRSAVARHPRTPRAVAMRFVPHLFWRELLELSVDTRIRSPVRRQAERYLVQRAERLTTGEKTALARRATESVAESLVTDPSLRVLDALLANPRMTENALMPLLTSKHAAPRALEAVARDPRWGRRYEVRLALARNPKAPSREILRFLPLLQRDDLEAVAELEDQAWVVTHRAREILEEWPADRFRSRARRIAAEEDSRIRIDAVDSEL